MDKKVVAEEYRVKCRVNAASTEVDDERIPLGIFRPCNFTDYFWGHQVFLFLFFSF